MLRLLGVVVAVLALAALALSHGIVSAQPGTVREGKQLVCHISDD